MGTWTEQAPLTGSTDQCEFRIEAIHTATSHQVHITLTDGIDSPSRKDAGSSVAEALGDLLDGSGVFQDIYVYRGYVGAGATYTP
jgi:hypothetical protein